MTRLSIVALVSALSVLACKGDDGDELTPTIEPTDTGEGDTQTETGAEDPVCVAGGGVYGKCTDNLCQCILGGDIYQYCSKPCADVSECGDPSEFPGATPSCEPLNPGETDMICVLRCATTADCPCGLECDSTFLLCSEPQP